MELGVKQGKLLVVSLTAKMLSVLGMENTVHTSEAAGVSASITFSYTCSVRLNVQIYTHTNSKASWLFLSQQYQWAHSCSPHTIRLWWLAWRNPLSSQPRRVQQALAVYAHMDKWARICTQIWLFMCTERIKLKHPPIFYISSSVIWVR